MPDAILPLGYDAPTAAAASRDRRRKPPGGGDGVAGPVPLPTMLPLTTPGGSARTPTTASANFTASLDRERAETARTAAVFAANAPLPATTGRYASAYGSPRAAAAARAAYVDRQGNRADQASGGYYARTDMAHDANDRATAVARAEAQESASAAALDDARAADLKLKGETAYPAYAAEAHSRAARNHADANYTLPYGAAERAANANRANATAVSTVEGVPVIKKQAADSAREAATLRRELSRVNGLSPSAQGTGGGGDADDLSTILPGTPGTPAARAATRPSVPSAMPDVLPLTPGSSPGAGATATSAGGGGGSVPGWWNPGPAMPGGTGGGGGPILPGGATLAPAAAAATPGAMGVAAGAMIGGVASGGGGGDGGALTPEVARAILAEAGGDKARARAMARARGYRGL